MENLLVPYQAIAAIPCADVLVLAPHPDDEVFGCGGAIMRHVEHGISVQVIIVSDGAYGLEGNARSEHIQQRQQESLNAAAYLGYGVPEFWGLRDREVLYGEKLVCRILDAIQDVDLIYAPSVFEMHPDHRALGMAVIEAVRRHSNKSLRLALYEVGVPLCPNLLLDISDLAQRKMAAMECFVSQNEKQRYDLDIAALNRFRTYTLPAEVTAAEAYTLVSAEEVANDPLKLYQSEYKRQRELGLTLDTKDAPLVSVLIRSMDRDTLSEALDSIALQTYPNIEVVVINAKGTEHRELGEWCGRFPLRLIGTNQPLKRSQAANIGLNDACGEYLIFLDDDDTFDPDHIANLTHELHQHSEIKAVYTGIRVENDKKQITGCFNFSFDQRRLLATNFIPIHALLFSRSLIEKGRARFDENMDVYEDWDFWLQLSRHTSFLHVNKVSATYWARGDSGVGLLADEDMQQQGREQLFEKWRLLWSGKEINCLSQYAINQEQKLAECDHQIATLNQTIVERDEQVAKTMAERDEQVAKIIAERDELIAKTIAERDEQIAKTMAERDELIAKTIAERDEQITAFTARYNEALTAIEEIRGSTSWQLTAPIRWSVHQVKRAIHLLRILPMILQRGGGVASSTSKLIFVVRREGFLGIKRRLLALSQPVIDENRRFVGGNDYAEWLRRYDIYTDTGREKIRARISRLPYTPLISIVMPVYNPPLNMLKEAIQSVQNQLYPYWELCIADDASTDEAVRELLQGYAEKEPRIKVVFRDQNGHISAASNSALELVSGEYIALLDNDDLLPEQALFWIVKALADHPDAGLIYSDEDKIDELGRRYDPYFKSDWNPDLFLSHNMICHLGVYRVDLVRKLGGFREGYEGAQDYDLALRCTEQLAPQQIVHIPRVLYHWRSHPGSTAQAGSEKNYALLAGERALNDHFMRAGISAKAELLDFGMYRARYDIPQPGPLVSLIIPTRNALNLTKQCVESILAKTTYKNYEIIIVDNNSDDPQTLAYFASLSSDSKISVLRDERPFNYSTLNNDAVLYARGEYIGLINNDIEVISPQWLDEMISLAIQPGVGAVGARLWYPNDTLQHGGVISGLGGLAGHSHKHLPKEHPGYFYRAQLIQTLSAVTAACLVIKKSIYQEVRGLDGVNLKVAFNDVDFCLRVREAGYRNIWTPYAELYHHESATRGYEDTPEKQLRFQEEVLYMQKRWGDILLNDPAYSPNLTLDREDFSFAWPPRVEQI
jgi:glycosyltransferase involved in cell wall biosynthesis/LmbE family N-acetylglucosaminyl deacetylase